jgi:hypothetical protein
LKFRFDITNCNYLKQAPLGDEPTRIVDMHDFSDNIAIVFDVIESRKSLAGGFSKAKIHLFAIELEQNTKILGGGDIGM